MVETKEGTTYRYEYSDEKSNKYWEITVDGDSYTVAYGRIGNNPQLKTKEFSSIEITLKEANKIRILKEKKGYTLV